jgi:hypothetical protein
VTRTTVIVLIALVVVIAVIALLVIRRRRYIQALEAKGWTFESSPSLESVLDHRAPPFGLGFDRSTDESISGRTSGGVPFHVFSYKSGDGGPSFRGTVASLSLRRALPTLFVNAGEPREGVDLAVLDVGSPWSVRAENPEYARAVLSGPVTAAISDFAAAGGRVDLSLDGTHLVAVGAPDDPDELAAYLEALAPVAAAVDATGLDRYAVPAPAPHFGFYGRPDWTLTDRDDTLIDAYGLTRAGSHHRTEHVVRSPNDGLPLEAFVHRWQTTRTEHYTDSEGRSRTRTVTDQHDETVCAVRLPGPFPQLSVNGGWGGQRVRFELEEFNDQFAVRTDQPKLAYDIFHPRTMELLMANEPPGFQISGTVLRFLVSRHDTVLIGQCADFAHELLARVPSFVWEDLRIRPPRFRSRFSGSHPLPPPT